jgi:hypothetical protein
MNEQSDGYFDDAPTPMNPDLTAKRHCVSWVNMMVIQKRK